MIDGKLVIPGLAALKEDYLLCKCGVNVNVIDRAIELLKEKDRIISALQSDLNETLEVVAEQSNVVRCKDCIYKPHCAYQIHAQTIGKENDWFCADGVRRDDCDV